MHESYELLARELTELRVDVLMKEFDRTLKEKGVSIITDRAFLPYVVGAAALALSGREVDRNGVSRLLQSINITPDKDLLNEFESLNYKNHMVYIDALYFILIVGREPSEELLINVGKAMNIKPDSEAAKFVVDLYQETKPI